MTEVDVRVIATPGPNYVKLWEQPDVYRDGLNPTGIDNAPGINAVLAAASYGDVVLLGPYEYGIKSPLLFDQATNTSAFAFELRGENTTAVNVAPSAIVWRGGIEPDINLIDLNAGRIVITGVHLYLAAGGHELQNLVQYGDVNRKGTAQAASASSVTLRAADTMVDAGYVGYRVTITGGTASGSESIVTAYDAATRVATIDAWTSGTPDATSTYRIESPPKAKSWCKFKDVVFGVGAKLSHVDFADPRGGSNLENTMFDRCRFDGADNTYAMVHIGPQGQPYSTVFYSCAMFGGSDTAPNCRGIYVRGSSVSVWCYGCDFQQLANAVQIEEPVDFTILGGQFEHCGRIIDAVVGAAGTTITVEGARIESTSWPLAATNPTRAAGNDVWAYANLRGSIAFRGCTIGAGSGSGTLEPGVIGYGRAANVLLEGCTLPNGEIVRETGDALAEGGGIHVRGCSVADFDSSALAHEAPRFRGRFNADGFVEIGGADTTATVRLPNAERDTRYDVRLSLHSASAGAAVGSDALPQVTARTVDTFTITGIAPGITAGPTRESVVFGYAIEQKADDFAALTDEDSLLWLWDAAAGVTGSPTVTSWVDQVAGEDLVSSTGAPTFNAADANLNEQPSITFAVGDRLISSSPASTYTRLNDGSTNYTIAVVFYSPTSGSSTHYVLGTKSGPNEIGPHDEGAALNLNPGSGSSAWNVSNGVASTAVIAPSPGVAVGADHVIARARRTVAGVSGEGEAISKQSTQWIAPVSYTAPPGDPADPFLIQGFKVAGSWSVALVAVFERDLPNATIERMIATYLRPRFGDAF
jgi:hypothetical protein